MCIAIIKPAGKTLDERVLRTCFANNPDGAGFALHDPYADCVVVYKGFTTADTFISAYRNTRANDATALIHCRITTRGTSDMSNCHPFLTEHGAFAHNGTIRALGTPGVGKSDTRLFAEMLNTLAYDQLVAMQPILEGYIERWNKVAFLASCGRVLVLNREHWIDEDGVLFSNSGYMEHDRYARWFPYSARTDDYEYEPDEPLIKAAEGFFWAGTSLYRINGRGTYTRDKDVEQQALQAWSAIEGADDDMLERITFDLIQTLNEETTQ